MLLAGIQPIGWVEPWRNPKKSAGSCNGGVAMAQFNRFIFSLSKLGVGAIEGLFKASVHIHGRENILDGIVIFVVNHFTRLETLILPYELFRITGRPVMSLVHHGLFEGALGNFLEHMGAVSTRDPNRDRTVIRSLLVGDSPWLIFPEGSMIKDKKIVERGKFRVYSDTGSRRSPHTGAAVYALRTEFYRKRIHHLRDVSPDLLSQQLEFFDLKSPEQVSRKQTYLVPVNVSYYPIRPRQNALQVLASTLKKDIPDQFLEELETEGTMLLSGVDMDICFGKPIPIRAWLQEPNIQQDITSSSPILPDEPIPSRPLLRKIASKVTLQVMKTIYLMTAVNFDHLAAYVLKYYPKRKLTSFELMERLFMAMHRVCHLKDVRCHPAIEIERIPKPIGEYHRMLSDFLDVARQSKVIEILDGIIVKKRLFGAGRSTFQTIRRDNPYLVIVNEVEYLHSVTRRLRLVAQCPQLLANRRLRRQFLEFDQRQFATDYAAYRLEGESKPPDVGAPFLLKRAGAKTGVLLVHGYMAAPEEVRPLAAFLRRHGYTVYACRLPGHGTNPEDLAGRSWQEWLMAAERGYLILASLCQNIVLGGFSCGSGVALLAGSENLPKVKAVFAINPPVKLRRKAAKFAPAVVLWSRLIERISGSEARQYFVPNQPENPDINYTRNPVSGVRELMALMERVADRLEDFTLPVLVIQGSDDPVVEPQGSEDLYRGLGTKEKEYAVFPADRHVIIRGKGAERIFQRTLSFIESKLSD
jgi:esterase/lipase/1-acyl-sn-glycerol-3-phosphate acyltransferase